MNTTTTKKSTALERLERDRLTAEVSKAVCCMTTFAKINWQIRNSKSIGTAKTFEQFRKLFSYDAKFICNEEEYHRRIEQLNDDIYLLTLSVKAERERLNEVRKRIKKAVVYQDCVYYARQERKTTARLKKDLETAKRKKAEVKRIEERLSKYTATMASELYEQAQLSFWNYASEWDFTAGDDVKTIIDSNFDRVVYVRVIKKTGEVIKRNIVEQISAELDAWQYANKKKEMQKAEYVGSGEYEVDSNGNAKEVLVQKGLLGESFGLDSFEDVTSINAICERLELTGIEWNVVCKLAEGKKKIDIAEELGVHRSLLYRVIDSLKAKCLADEELNALYKSGFLRERKGAESK